MSKLHFELIAATDEHADNLEAVLGPDNPLTLEARSLYGLSEWIRVSIQKGFRVAGGGTWRRRDQIQEREARDVYERYSAHLPHRKGKAPLDEQSGASRNEDAA